MTYDPNDKEHGLIYMGSAHDPGPTGKMTRALEAAWKAGEDAAWDEYSIGLWDGLCVGMGAITFYTNDEIEVQIVNRLADGRDKPKPDAPQKAARKPVKRLKRKG